jgi:hypothetical protein
MDEAHSRYTSIDLFCGAGGLTEGLRLAGFDTKVGVDFEKNARVDEAFLLTVVTGRIGRCTEEH